MTTTHARSQEHLDLGTSHPQGLCCRAEALKDSSLLFLRYPSIVTFPLLWILRDTSSLPKGGLMPHSVPSRSSAGLVVGFGARQARAPFWPATS